MRHTILAAAAALAVLTGGAAARDIPAGGLTINDIVKWLQDAGYKAEIQKNASGDLNVYSAAEGSGFHIYQYDCKQSVCGSLQFSVGFDTKGAFNAVQMNEWNKKNRWTRAYIDTVNDPWLEQDVDLTPGGTYENLDDEFAVWRAALRHFREEMKP